VTPVIFAQLDLPTLLQSPLVWGLAVSALGFWVTLSGEGKRIRTLGQLVSAVGLVVLAVAFPKLTGLATLTDWSSQGVFWLMSAAAIGCSAAAVCARNPVYTAIWFAGSLLGVAGLFMYQNAQFLGVATIVVYAGAIVVTFLFVLMLANPEGTARYDRVGWARFPAPLMIVAALMLVAILSVSLTRRPPEAIAGGAPVSAPDQMAYLGGELFARHLIAVEVAGTILLVALVGAIAIVIHGKSVANELRSTRQTTAEGESR
jgi:NADH-quinone oxidoreductase subunit J